MPSEKVLWEAEIVKVSVMGDSVEDFGDIKVSISGF